MVKVKIIKYDRLLIYTIYRTNYHLLVNFLYKILNSSRNKILKVNLKYNFLKHYVHAQVPQ